MHITLISLRLTSEKKSYFNVHVNSKKRNAEIDLRSKCAIFTHILLPFCPSYIREKETKQKHPHFIVVIVNCQIYWCIFMILFVRFLYILPPKNICDVWTASSGLLRFNFFILSLRFWYFFFVFFSSSWNLCTLANLSSKKAFENIEVYFLKCRNYFRSRCSSRQKSFMCEMTLPADKERSECMYL